MSVRVGLPRKTHGHASCAGWTPEYQAWLNMRDRCTRPSYNEYKNYGGRGIRVCERWATSFENFLADMGPRPEGMSLERKDNDKNYEPSNCRWATRKEQARNTSRTVLIELSGETKPLMDWCEERNLNHRTIRKRLQSGWPADRAFGTPTRARYIYGRR